MKKIRHWLAAFVLGIVILIIGNKNLRGEIIINPPNIHPAVPQVGEEVLFTIEIDGTDISEVTVIFSTGSIKKEIPLTLIKEKVYQINLPPLSAKGVVYYQVKVKYGKDKIVSSPEGCYIVVDKPMEYRAFWVDTYGQGILSRGEVDALVNTARENNVNTLIVEVRKIGDAYYNSAFEPRATNIKEDFDPLEYLISRAHEKGEKYVEIHAWFVAYKIMNNAGKDILNKQPTHVTIQYPYWIMNSSDGKKDDVGVVFLDPGIPEVNDYTLNVIMDAVKKYDIDGVNLDYFRYPGKNWGYTEISVRRFNKLYRRENSPDANDKEWSAFRREQVTNFLRKLYTELISIKPNLKISVDTVGWGSITNDDFTNSSPYTDALQDWPLWTKMHIVDFNCRMGYKRESVERQAKDYREWLRFSLATQYGRFSLIGQGAYLSNPDDNITQLRVAQESRAPGTIIYSYRSMCKAPEDTPQFMEKLKSTVYTSWVDVPPLAWKQYPTTGVVKGTVKDKKGNPLDRAEIRIEFADIYISPSYTDGSGYFAVMDVPAGEHNLILNGEVVKKIKIEKGQVVNAGELVFE